MPLGRPHTRPAGSNPPRTGIYRSGGRQPLERGRRRPFLDRLGLAAIISAILVLPFMVLELVNRRHLQEDYPGGVFGLLWIVAVAFILLLLDLVGALRAGTDIPRKPAGPLLRAASLFILAWIWVSAVLDQRPCFLGVPLCD